LNPVRKRKKTLINPNTRQNTLLRQQVPMKTPLIRLLQKNITKKIGERRPTRKPLNPQVAERVLLLATPEKKLVLRPNPLIFLKNIPYEVNTEWIPTTLQKTSNGQLVITSL